MESETEDDARNEKVTQSVRAEAPEKEKEGECENERDHDGSEADAREVDGPV